MRELVKSLLVTLVTLVIALACAEAAFRAVSGKTVFALTKYRAASIVYNVLPKHVASYDPLLGWRLNAGVRTAEFNTIDYGVRRNNAADDHLRTGGVLVSGASFTEGSDVKDEDAWPSQLETLIGRPVVNGAVGGFGIDQIVMRAEELLPIVKPQLLIVDLVQENIGIAGYSYNGYPKPYFTIEDNRLVLRNHPVPPHQPRDSRFELVKDVLSYSFMLDRFMATYFPDTWYSSQTQNFTRANNDDVKVSCLLLQRLKKETAAANIRLLVTMQYSSGAITNERRPDGNALLVEDCLRRMGIQFIDEFADLKTLWQNHPDEFRSFYVVKVGLLAHKSHAGNLAFAKMVAAALALPPPASTSSTPAADQESRDTQAANDPPLRNDDIVPRFQFSDAAIEEERATSTGHAYRIIAAGKPGEHYVWAPIPGGGGTWTFSVEARADTSSALRLQLCRGDSDGMLDGVIGDFDLGRVTAAPWRQGLGTDIEVGIEPTDGHWFKLWITGTLPPSEKGHNQIIIELADTHGRNAFTPDGEAVKTRNLTIERRSLPSGQQVNAAGPNVH